MPSIHFHWSIVHRLASSEGGVGVGWGGAGSQAELHSHFPQTWLQEVRAYWMIILKISLDPIA